MCTKNPVHWCCTKNRRVCSVLVCRQRETVWIKSKGYLLEEMFEKSREFCIFSYNLCNIRITTFHFEVYQVYVNVMADFLLFLNV